MTRVSLVPAVFGAIVVVAMGARPSPAQQTTAPPETLIRLSVAPAPAPKPLLRYLLLPELKEMNPGNPIEGYLKCYLDQYRFAFDVEGFERRDTLLAMPLEELPGADVRELGRFALAEADRAARLDNPDWQILLKLKADGINTLLPDLQAMRALARALQVRFRAEAAAGRLDDAIRTAKTMFAMARHMGEHPTLIGHLVAIACANLAISPLEEMLEQPHCPNLYWALTDLPAPLISIKTGMDGERLIIWSLFRDLNSTAPMNAEQITRFIEPLDNFLRGAQLNQPAGGIRGYVGPRSKDERQVSAARARLVESGLLEASVKTFPPDQVILLDEARECQARFDEIITMMPLPAWQFEALAEKHAAVKEQQAFFADALLPMPSLVRARRAHARLEQRIALVRHVEALRMYAAGRDGAFPASLAEISVPLPVDPFTGKPFGYERSGKTAHLRGTPPSAEKNAEYRIHYEITFRE